MTRKHIAFSLLSILTLVLPLDAQINAQNTIHVVEIRKDVLNVSMETVARARALGVTEPGDYGVWYASYWHNFQDWNNDQKDDLVLALAGKENEILVGLFIQGDQLQFNEQHEYLMYADGGLNDFSTTIGDINRDGLFDVYLAGYWNEDPSKNNPASLFINNGNGFNSFHVDTTLLNLDEDALIQGADPVEKSTGVMLDLDLDGNLDLHFPQACWQYKRGHLLRKYEVQSDGRLDVQYLPTIPDGLNDNDCWDTTYDYVKVIDDTLYAAFWRNIEQTGKEHADFKVCKWVLPIMEANHSVDHCLDIVRDPALYAQRDIGDNFGFWVVDLNQDGILEYVFLMFTPFPDGQPPNVNNGEYYHSSIHVFDSEGMEMTSDWFDGEQYLEKNLAAANGIYVIDLNRDGFPDILPISGFYSPTAGDFLYLNTGEEFIQTTVRFPTQFRDQNFVQNRSEYGWRIPVDLTGDYRYEILHVKMDTYDRANANIVFLDYDSAPVSVGENSDLPAQVSLSQNYPNPFNPSTTIRFDLPEVAVVRLEVFNMLGQSVGVLVDGVQQAGIHAVDFNASRLSTGVYFYRFEATGFTQTRQMMLIK